MVCREHVKRYEVCEHGCILNEGTLDPISRSRRSSDCMKLVAAKASLLVDSGCADSSKCGTVQEMLI